MAVHCPLPPGCVGQQPRGYYRCVRDRLEQPHRRALFENSVARSRADCTFSERRYAFLCFSKAHAKLLWLFDRPIRILSRTVHYHHVYSRILVCNLTSIVSIRTKTAASYSITSWVSALYPKSWHLSWTAVRLGWPCRPRTSRIMALDEFMCQYCILHVAIELGRMRWSRCLSVVRTCGWVFSICCVYHLLTIFQGLVCWTSFTLWCKDQESVIALSHYERTSGWNGQIPLYRLL